MALSNYSDSNELHLENQKKPYIQVTKNFILTTL